MATITEKIDGRKYTRDVNGTVAASRTFICLNAANEHSARVAFEEYPDSRQFPGATDFGLVLDRIDIEGRGGGSHYIINATYCINTWTCNRIYSININNNNITIDAVLVQ